VSNHSQIEVLLNGQTRAVPEGQTVLELLASLDIPSGRVAVEFDRRILPRADWAATRLHPGAQIEIVHFVGGG